MKNIGRYLAIIGLALQAPLLAGIVMIAIGMQEAISALGTDIDQVQRLLDQSLARSFNLLVWAIPLSQIGTIVLAVVYKWTNYTRRWIVILGTALTFLWIITLALPVIISLLLIAFVVPRKKQLSPNQAVVGTLPRGRVNAPHR